MQSVNPLDEAAFTELYVQHVDAVYRICYSFLKIVPMPKMPFRKHSCG